MWAVGVERLPSTAGVNTSFTRPISLASAALFLSTLIWPTVQLSSTDILLKRLKDWKTIPTFVR